MFGGAVELHVDPTVGPHPNVSTRDQKIDPKMPRRRGSYVGQYRRVDIVAAASPRSR